MSHTYSACITVTVYDFVPFLNHHPYRLQPYFCFLIHLSLSQNQRCNKCWLCWLCLNTKQFLPLLSASKPLEDVYRVGATESVD